MTNVYSQESTVQVIVSGADQAVVSTAQTVAVVSVDVSQTVVASQPVVHTASVVDKTTVVAATQAVHVVEVGSVGIPGASWVQTFETLANNLTAKPCTLSYSGARLLSASYAMGAGQTITKTIGYTGEKVTSITLNGDVPLGAATTKIFGYTGDALSSINYS